MSISCSTALRRGAVTCLLMIVGSASVAASWPVYRGRQWLCHYYEKPAPDQFVPAIFELSRNNYFAMPGHTTLGIGFIASVLRQNPDRIDDWMLQCRPLPESERRLLIAALWYAGHPKGESYLDYYAENIVDAEMATRLRTVMTRPVSFEEVEIRSLSSLYLQWGVFLATGDEAVLIDVLAAADTLPDIGIKERWWLACAAAEHRSVVSWCEAAVARDPDNVAGIAQLILNAGAVAQTE
ncbi:hypothetical protein [Synoicihabitans lomoniglobus]|uniref:Uncharacterized protein n=1 Tax=Synoicihabitans lomoniglobus TaxID=2909285 RepID=A0AAF0CMW1_9BACT|nr:hypothetical protein [Opitutaceae bacterium LMO-M01]WED63620.1 hypothetical protein PXH66_14885 [Opitutaceae bacterium LMO-M01]